MEVLKASRLQLPGDTVGLALYRVEQLRRRSEADLGELRQLCQIRAGEGAPLLEAPAASGETHGPLGRDMKGLGRKRFDHGPDGCHDIVGKADGGTEERRAGLEAIRPHDFDRLALRPQFGHQTVKHPLHAMMHRQPEIGGDEDAQGALTRFWR